MVSARTLKTQTPSRPGDETGPPVSTKKPVNSVYAGPSLTTLPQVKVIATTAMAGGKLSTAQILMADNKDRTHRSEVSEESPVTMATATADRQALA
jgi:hypothetical protein